MTEYVKEFDIAGKVMIFAGFGFSIASFLPLILPLHLLISPKYSSLGDFGPAGRDIIMAFSVHIGALVIALGIMLIYISRHYSPEIERYLVSCVVIWFVLDSSSSIIYNYGYNVVLNLVYLLAFIGVLTRVKTRNQSRI